MLNLKTLRVLRAPSMLVSALAAAVMLVAGNAGATPLGLNYDINFDDFGVVGGADLDQTALFDGTTTKTVGDTSVTEQVRLQGDGREVIEFNVSAGQPLVNLSSNVNTGWRIGFENIVHTDGVERIIDELFFAFSVGGSFITASPGTPSFNVVPHPIDGHSTISLNPFHPTIGTSALSIGSSSGGFATFQGLMEILIGDPAVAAQFDGIQVGMVVSPIPEPGTALLMGLGLAGLAGTRKRSA